MPFIMIFFFAFAFILYISHIVGREFINGIDSNGLLNNADGREVASYTLSSINGMDYVFIIVLIGMIIYMIVSASALDTHPAFFIAGLIMLAIFLVISFGIANSFQSLSASNDFVNESDTFAGMTFILNNYPIFLLGIGLIVLVALFAKGVFR